MRIRAINSMQLLNRRRRRAFRRAEDGITMMEMMCACVVGSILLLGIYTTVMSMYRQCTTSEQHIIATNMAQQVIDNARNSTFTKLLSFGSATQTLSLLDYPGNPAAAMFPRPLLRNENAASGMTYSAASIRKVFNGTVTETLTNLSGAATSNRLIRVTVNINWTDSNGPHNYQTGTVVSETGIHN